MDVNWSERFFYRNKKFHFRSDKSDCVEWFANQQRIPYVFVFHRIQLSISSTFPGIDTHIKHWHSTDAIVFHFNVKTIHKFISYRIDCRHSFCYRKYLCKVSFEICWTLLATNLSTDNLLLPISLDILFMWRSYSRFRRILQFHTKYISGTHIWHMYLIPIWHVCISFYQFNRHSLWWINHIKQMNMLPGKALGSYQMQTTDSLKVHFWVTRFST